jgi:hypothetical protein
MSPILFPKYANFSFWTKALLNIWYLLIDGDILENHFSLLDFITEDIMLDLNVLRSVMEHWFSLKAFT